MCIPMRTWIWTQRGRAQSGFPVTASAGRHGTELRSRLRLEKPFSEALRRGLVELSSDQSRLLS